MQVVWFCGERLRLPFKASNSFARFYSLQEKITTELNTEKDYS
jgi:hypothetical protein